MEKSLKQSNYKTFYLNIFIAFMLLGMTLPAYTQVGVGLRPIVPKDDDRVEINYSNPREYEITTIEVDGLETLDKNALISLSGLKIGDKIRIPGEATANAIRKLMKSGIIGDVSIYLIKVEGDKASLRIQLMERPRLTKILAQGSQQNTGQRIKRRSGSDQRQGPF